MSELSRIHGVGAVDCFHNGDKALEAVRRSHQRAVDRIRSLGRKDFITEKVVGMIDDMLVETNDRPTAESLWRKQGRIIESAKKVLQDSKGPSDGTQPRSRTYPVPGPSDPAMPPVIPPGYPQNLVVLRPTERSNLAVVHEHDREDGPVNGVLPHDVPRHHSPDIISHENRSSETTPVHEQTSTRTLQNASPLTPMFSPKPLHSKRVVSGGLEDPFTSNRPFSQVSDSNHRIPNGFPIRQSTVELEEPTHRPVLRTVQSEYKTLNDVLHWKRKCKIDKVYTPCLNTRHQSRLKGRDHVSRIIEYPISRTYADIQSRYSSSTTRIVWSSIGTT